MITPIEIQRKTFKSGIGYDRREVDTFLKEVSAGYEKLYKDNIELLDKFNALNDRVQYYKTVEETLQKTLVYAEKAAEDIRNAARVEAKNIQNEAKLNANKILADATYERDGIHLKSMALVRQFEQYKAQYKQILAVQTDLITSDFCSIELSDYDISEFLSKPESGENPIPAEIYEEEPLLQVNEGKQLDFPSQSIQSESIKINEPDQHIEIEAGKTNEPAQHIEIESMEAVKTEQDACVNSADSIDLETVILESTCSDTCTNEESNIVGIKKLDIHENAVPIMEAAVSSSPVRSKRELTEEEEKEELAKMLKQITGNVGFNSNPNDSSENSKDLNICDTEEEIDWEAFEFIDTEKDIK